MCTLKMVKLNHVHLVVPNGQKRTHYIIFDAKTIQASDKNMLQCLLKIARHSTVFKDNPGFLSYFVETYVKTADTDDLLVGLLSNDALPVDEAECLLQVKQARRYKDLITKNPAFHDYVLKNYRDYRSYVCIDTMCSMEIFFDIALTLPHCFRATLRGKLLSNPKLTAEFITKFRLLKSDWIIIFNNKSVVWTREMVDTYFKMGCFAYDDIIRHGLMRQPDFVDYAIEIGAGWDENRFITLSGNTHVVFTHELIGRYETKWDWTALSKNESVEFTLDALIKFQHRWKWELVCKNVSFLSKWDCHKIRTMIIGKLLPEVWNYENAPHFIRLLKVAEPSYDTTPNNAQFYFRRGRCILAENEDGSGVIRVFDVTEGDSSDDCINRMKCFDDWCEMLNDDAKALEILQRPVTDWSFQSETPVRDQLVRKKVLPCTLDEIPLAIPKSCCQYCLKISMGDAQFEMNMGGCVPDFIKSIVQLTEK